MLKNIVYNEFKCMVDVTGELPWKQVKPGWGDTDISCAKLYFERVYGIWSPTKFKDALLAGGFCGTDVPPHQGVF